MKSCARYTATRTLELKWHQGYVHIQVCSEDRSGQRPTTGSGSFLMLPNIFSLKLPSSTHCKIRCLTKPDNNYQSTTSLMNFFLCSQCVEIGNGTAEVSHEQCVQSWSIVVLRNSVTQTTEPNCLLVLLNIESIRSISIQSKQDKRLAWEVSVRCCWSMT